MSVLVLSGFLLVAATSTAARPPGQLQAADDTPAATPVGAPPTAPTPGFEAEALAASLEAALAGEPQGDLRVAELFGGIMPLPSTIGARLASVEESLGQARVTLAALAAKLAQAGDLEPPEPLAEPQAPPAAPQVVNPDRPTHLERRALREHQEQMQAHAVEMEAYEARAAEHAKATERYRERLVVRDRLTAEARSTRLRLWILEAQVKVFTLLGAAFDDMPAPALRAFELLGQPRAPIREQARSLESLEAANAALLERLRALGEMLAAGRLVGFVAEQSAAQRQLDLVAKGVEEHGARATELREELLALAESQERDGRRVRQALIWSLASPAGIESRDELYLEHLRKQRQLRRALARATSSNVAAALDAWPERAGAALARPAAIGDVFAADRAIGEAQQVSLELGRLLDDLAAAPDRWALAFERELVTLLEAVASEQTRTDAQRLTAEIIDDLQIEAMDAWSRTVGWARSFPEELRRLAGDWRRVAVRGIAVLLLLLLAVLLGSKRWAPMGLAVRRATRLPLLRRRIGLVVRWGTVLQTVFPSVAVYVLLWAVARTVGFERIEVQLVWLFVHWIGLYWIGRQIVVGVTQPVSPGRPALVDVRPESVDLLRVTYGRLGLIFAISFIIEELAAGWFGAGRVRALIDIVILLWTGAWGFWAALAWRDRLGAGWMELDPGPRESRLAQWMRQGRLGALLSPLAFARIAARRVWRAAWWLLQRVGVITYLRAQSLQRKSKGGEGEAHAITGELPEDYLAEFPLYPLLNDTDAFVLPRPASVEPIQTQLVRWKEGRTDGSVVLIGEKGLGKTTLLAQLAPTLEHEVTFHTWGNKAITEAQVARELGPLFDCPHVDEVAPLIAAAREGPERVILLDEVHNVFLRTINGYRGFDALVELVNGTHEKVFWVLTLNTFAWEFLNESRGRTHYFRRLVRLKGWTVEELTTLIDNRNRRSGYPIIFDPVILDADAEARDFQLVESADGFFHLLWQTAAGNPRVGLYLWLQSVQSQFGSIRAKLFKQPDIDDVDGLTDELVFVLASICQHENLSPEDLGTVLRMKPGQARFAIQFLREAGLIEPKHGSPGSFTLAPRYYQQTRRFLRRRHLLFEAS